MAQPTPSSSSPKVVDIHTHMYPPSYVSMLKSRSSIPLVRTFPSSPDPRLILLSAEVPLLEEASTSSSSSILPGRPLTAHYSSLPQKIHFMDTHNIDISVLSLANPWLDFLSASESPSIAHETNISFSEMCASHPGRLYFFGALPLTAPLPEILACISHLSTLPYCRGIILGTSGLGTGLDDPDLLPIFTALADANLTIFLHPHYGLPNEVYGPADRQKQYGHVLPLALGFPMETTIAVTRMFLAGVFDAVPKLQMILAHSGGTLPFLAGRIESCIAHDGHLYKQNAGKDRRTIWEVSQSQIYLDAVVYSDVGIQAAVAASGGTEGSEGTGADRLMFGTDHPFFPPLGTDEQGQWESVSLNAEAVKKALGGDSKESEKVMGGNAIRVLRLSGE
ncbi:amidohydrolase [Naviculisporaceae sp. PSN 640]